MRKSASEKRVGKARQPELRNFIGAVLIADKAAREIASVQADQFPPGRNETVEALHGSDAGVAARWPGPLRVEPPFAPRSCGPRRASERPGRRAESSRRWPVRPRRAPSQRVPDRSDECLSLCIICIDDT